MNIFIILTLLTICFSIGVILDKLCDIQDRLSRLEVNK